VLLGRGLCDELITRPEESYRLWCVVVCDLETSRMRRPWPALGRSATRKKIVLLHLTSLNYTQYISMLLSSGTLSDRFYSCFVPFRAFQLLRRLFFYDITG